MPTTTFLSSITQPIYNLAWIVLLAGAVGLAIYCVTKPIFQIYFGTSKAKVLSEACFSITSALIIALLSSIILIPS